MSVLSKNDENDNSINKLESSYQSQMGNINIQSNVQNDFMICDEGCNSKLTRIEKVSIPLIKAQWVAATGEPGVWDHEPAQGAVAGEEPGVQEHKTALWAVAREEPGLWEDDSAQWAAAREEPGVQK